MGAERLTRLAALPLALVLMGCAPGNDSEQRAASSYEPPSNSGARTFFQAASGVGEALSRVRYGAELVDYLPNQTFEIAGGKPRRISSGIVLGRVQHVDGLASYYVPGDSPSADAASGTRLPFGDRLAMWSTAEVTLAVEDTLGVAGDPDVVKVGVVLSDVDDPQGLLDGLSSLDDVVVVLDQRPDRLFGDTTYAVAENGDLFGDVDASGQIGFPVLGRVGSSEFVGDLTTWAEVQAAAKVERQPIKTDALGLRR